MKSITFLGIIILLSSLALAVDHTYYTFDNTLKDSFDNFSLTDDTGATYTSAVVGNGVVCSNDFYYNNSNLIGTLTQVKTISLWLNIDSGQSDHGYYGGLNKDNNGDTDMIVLHYTPASTRLEWYIVVGNDLKQNIISTSISKSTWYHLVLVNETNGTTTSYINGQPGLNTADTVGYWAADNWDNILWCKHKSTTADEANGILDNIYFSTERATQDDVTAWYNGGSGYNHTPVTAISWLNPTPASGVTNNSLPTFNATCTLGGNVTLWFDTNADPITAVIDSVEGPADYTPGSLSETTYYYKASCDGGTATNTSVRTFTYDASDPAITLGEGNSFNAANNSALINEYATELVLNISVQDNLALYGFLINVTLDSSGASYYNQSNESLSGLTWNITKTIDSTNFPSGNYTVDIFASDSHTAHEIKNYQVLKKPQEIQFTTTEKNIIKFITDEPVDITETKKKDRYSLEFEYSSAKINKKRLIYLECNNKLTYLPESNYTGHFICTNGFYGNWIDFESEYPLEENVKVKQITPNRYEIEFKTKDKSVKFNSIGGLNVNHKSYFWEQSDLTVNSVRISPNVSVTTDNIIGYCNATEGAGLNVSYQYRWYKDGALYTDTTNSSISYTSGKETLLNTLSSSLTSVGDSYIFSCRALANNQGTGWSNSSSKSIVGFLLDNCTSQPYPLFHLYYYDELDGIAINTSNTYNLFFDGDYSASINGSFGYGGTHSICTNLDPTNKTFNVSLTGSFLLKKDLYATRTFNFDSANSIYTTNANATNLSLPLIKLNESSTINYNWLTTTFEPINGILMIYKCVGNGSRNLIESTPIVDSKAVANLELLTDLYSYDVTYQGTLYQDFGSYGKCHIESETDLTYYVEVTEQELGTMLGISSIGCNVTKLSSTTVLMEWGTNPLSSSQITGCMKAYRKTISGTTEIFENCSLTSPITRTVNPNGNIVTVTGKVYQNGYSLQCESVEYSQTERPGSNFGVTGLLAVILMFLAGVLFYHAHGPTQLLVGGGVIVVAFFLGILILPWYNVVAIIALLIIGVIVGRTANKNE